MTVKVGFVIWWIVGGLLVLGLVLVVLVVATVLGHLRPLRRALRRQRLHLEQAQKLQARVEALQDATAELESKMELAQERSERLRARRQA